jgi:GTP-binding protein Era
MLKRIATEARKDMERMFGGKVFLQVWIKVRRGWSEDERTLRQLGYG